MEGVIGCSLDRADMFSDPFGGPFSRLIGPFLSPARRRQCRAEKCDFESLPPQCQPAATKKQHAIIRSTHFVFGVASIIEYNLQDFFLCWISETLLRLLVFIHCWTNRVFCG